MQAVVVAICLTVSRAFDVPVFWPILVFYFIVLFAVSMKSRVRARVLDGWGIGLRVVFGSAAAVTGCGQGLVLLTMPQLT